MMISGSCHCGNIKYQLATTLPQDALSYRECSCSFCSRLSAIYTSDPEGTLNIEISEPSQVSSYRFASKLVDFVFCATCGIMPVAQIEIDDQRYGVINLRTTNLDLKAVNITKLKIAGESIEASIARRRQKWTPIL